MFLCVFTCFGALWVLLVALGALLGILGRLLGRSWGDFGAVLDPLGHSWDALGALLGRSWGHVGHVLQKMRPKSGRYRFLGHHLGDKSAAKIMKNQC